MEASGPGRPVSVAGQGAREGEGGKEGGREGLWMRCLAPPDFVVGAGRWEEGRTGRTGRTKGVVEVWSKPFIRGNVSQACSIHSSFSKGAE